MWKQLENLLVPVHFKPRNKDATERTIKIAKKKDTKKVEQDAFRGN